MLLFSLYHIWLFVFGVCFLYSTQEVEFRAHDVLWIGLETMIDFCSLTVHLPSFSPISQCEKPQLRKRTFNEIFLT